MSSRSMKSIAESGPRRVESRQNARIKELRAGLSRGARTEQNRIAIEGLHLVQEAFKSGLKLHTVLVRAGNESLLEHLPLEQLPLRNTPEVLIVAEPVFLSAAAT